MPAAELSTERIAVDVAVARNADQGDRRLATTRAALVGAGLGGWLGMLTGLVLVLFIAGHAWLTLPLTGLLIGAFLGVFIGLVTHWATDGRPDRPSGR
jgi:hypothetical protein